MDITISWTNPASGAGGTPDHYDIYRATGNLTPEYNNAGDDLGSDWTKLSAIQAAHTSFDAATQVTDSTATAGSTYENTWDLGCNATTDTTLGEWR